MFSAAWHRLDEALHDRVMGRVAIVLALLSVGSVLGGVIQGGDASDVGTWLLASGFFLLGWAIWVLIIWHFVKLARAGGQRS